MLDIYIYIYYLENKNHPIINDPHCCGEEITPVNKTSSILLICVNRNNLIVKGIFI